MPDHFDQLAAEVMGAMSVPPYLLGITGVPGVGKSTLAEQLAQTVRQKLGDDSAAVIVPMDGFHLTNRELDRRGIRDRKGAPHTFDAQGFVALVRKLAAVPPVTVTAPIYDRQMHEPVADAITVRAGTPLVIVEGNYLLLDDEPWAQVAMHLDEVWYIDIDLDVAMDRVRQRHEAGGNDPAIAQARIVHNDWPNANLIARAAQRADRVVWLA